MKRQPGLTAYEASVLLRVAGDIDPAHFEGNSGAYHAAFRRAMDKLRAIRDEGQAAGNSRRGSSVDRPISDA